MGSICWRQNQFSKMCLIMFNVASGNSSPQRRKPWGFGPFPGPLARTRSQQRSAGWARGETYPGWPSSGLWSEPRPVMGGFLGISQGWWADFLDSMSSRLHFSSQTEQLIGVEKKHDCPRKDEIARCVRNHKPGFCSQILVPGKQTEINSRDKRQGCRCPENKSSILKHVDPFLGNSIQRGMRLSTKLRSFLQGKWHCLLEFMTFFLPAEIHKITWFLGGSARKSILFCCDLLPNLWGCQGKG